MNGKLLLCAMSVSCMVASVDHTNRFSLFVDALYWQAQEDGLDYAIQNNTGAVRINDGSVRRMHFDWRGGFRIGAGYLTPCGDYFVNAFWTRYHTKGDSCLAVTYPVTLFPVWSNPTSSLTSEQNSRVCNRLDLDMFDARVTALFHSHDRVEIMPSVGIVYARINQSFNIDMSGGQSRGPVATVLDDIVAMKNHFRGVGPKIGLNSLWDIACGFSLVAKGDAALTYGKFAICQNETTTFSNGVPTTVFLNLPCNRFHMTRPIVDLSLGVRFDRSFNKDACSQSGCNFYVEACWELNYFFAQNMLMRFSDDVTPGANIEVKGDLATQGLTVRVNVSF